MTTQTDHTTRTDVDVVRGGFASLAAGDLAAFAAAFHVDATWNHRNPDHLGGIKLGIEAIMAFIGASMELTGGSLRPTPEAFMSDGAGRVAVLVRNTASRPDGRRLDDTQILYFTVNDGRVRTIDQFVGDPPAVTAFWG